METVGTAMGNSFPVGPLESGEPAVAAGTGMFAFHVNLPAPSRFGVPPTALPIRDQATQGQRECRGACSLDVAEQMRNIAGVSRPSPPAREFDAMPHMLALLFVAATLGALLVLADAVRTLVPAARLLLGPQELAAQTHYRMVTVRRTAAPVISPAADRPQDRRLRPVPSRRQALPRARPAWSAAA
ncbi:hypothetical protein V5740_02570 [Croceibacterium sp. TMG7-5b_MA50]|uniref:hypothetical protein n=1 Tax=Croceibacterium sp. TMG7-5b_MA50 TaxID=3121290 RepID=UPI00322148CD